VKKFFMVLVFCPMLLWAQGFNTNSLNVLEGLIGIGKAVKEAKIEEMGPADEFFIGREAAARLLGSYKPLPLNHPAHAYVAQVGTTLQLASAAPYGYRPFTFIVLDSEEVNAFAAPGGIILITKGMLKFVQNEDELAAVLGHEIGHVAMAHGIQAIEKEKRLGVTSALADFAKDRALAKVNTTTAAVLSPALDAAIEQMGVSIRNGYSVEIEAEADKQGMDLLFKAGYDPYASLELIERFKTFKGSYGGAGYPEQRGSDAAKYLKEKNYPRRSVLPERTQRFQAMRRYF
jgi:predicted Zn-dependent protease